MAHQERTHGMQGVARFRTFIFFDFFNLFVEPPHHIAVMFQQRLDSGVLITQLYDARSQHVLIRQSPLQHAFGEGSFLDLGDAPKLGIIVPFHIRKRTNDLVLLHHAVEGIQLAAADHLLQRMAGLAYQLGDTG